MENFESNKTQNQDESTEFVDAKKNRSTTPSHAKHAEIRGEINSLYSSEESLSKPAFFLRVIDYFMFACLVFVAVACGVWFQGLPDYSDADAFNTIKPTEVYASDHTTLLARFQLENREPLNSIDEISSYVVAGTVATEDERFYDHGGIDLIGMGRAVLNNVLGGSLEGASTITQQLVRNTILLDEMDDITIKRKAREAYLAVEMEQMYSKEDILLLYMNTINYGAGAYGIEAAAQRYFSKSASSLTLAEAALLVGIPQSPSYNNPLYYPDNALERRNTVLDRMASNGVITAEEAAAAKVEPIELNPSEPSNDGFIEYPYFGSYVRDQLIDSYNISATEIFKGGLTVYTTLDVDMQEMAEAAADKAEGMMNQALCVGLTAIDPDTGQIKAMVGGKDFDDRQWNLASQEARQPGSSFKTFTLVTAIEQGISPQTNVNCSSSVTIGNNKAIENIDGAEYGTRSIESAFAVSSNTGFARLCEAVTPQSVSDTAHRMGITSDLDPVLSLTLGTSDVTTVEMADAYATIANGGTHYSATAIEQVLDRKGEVLLDETNPKGERALSEEVACAARKVMEGVVNGGTGTAARIYTGQPAAGKTGTSENYMDSYFAGFTPELSVAVWIGDPDRVVPATGLTGANVFGYFMNDWCQDREIVQFKEAADPIYSKKFSNADLDLKNVVSYNKAAEENKKATEEEDAKKEAEERKAKEDEAAKKNQATTSKNTSSETSSGSGSSGASGSGSSGSGGTSSGGSSGSGTGGSGGTSSGGSASGGSGSSGGSGTGGSSGSGASSSNAG